MLYPDKTFLVSGYGFSLQAPLAYRDILEGAWFLQIESVAVTNLPPRASVIATLTTPLVNAVEATVFGRFESVPKVLHQINIKADTSATYFTHLPTARFRITNPSPVFQVDIIAGALSDIERAACHAQVCCYLFKEL